MKKHHIWVHTVFLVLITLSIGTIILFYCQFVPSSDPNELKWNRFFFTLGLFLLSPILFFEIELYRVVRYFALCRDKSRTKTAINIVSILLMPVLYLAAIAVNWCRQTPSIIIQEIPILLAPVHFIIMRIVAWNWRYSRLAEDTGDKESSS